MNALQKNIAVARGEAIAASLLASAAIHVALSIVSNRQELLAKISASIDDTLNLSGPGRGMQTTSSIPKFVRRLGSWPCKIWMQSHGCSTIRRPQADSSSRRQYSLSGRCLT